MVRLIAVSVVAALCLGMQTFAFATDAVDSIGQAPNIIKYSVTPAVIEKEELITATIRIQYRDEDKDLYGGSLRVTVLNELGGTSKFSFPLNKDEYRKTSGVSQFVIKIRNDQSNWIRVTSRIFDAAKMGSSLKEAHLRVLGKVPGQRAFPFTLNDQNGNPVSLDSLKGKVVLLNFSGMWCGPCQDEAEEAETLYRRYKDRGFIIVEILFEDYNFGVVDQRDQQTWAQQYGITFPVLADTKKSVYGKFRGPTGGIPVNILIGRDQTILYSNEGFPDQDLNLAIQGALQP